MRKRRIQPTPPAPGNRLIEALGLIILVYALIGFGAYFYDRHQIEPLLVTNSQ